MENLLKLLTVHCPICHGTGWIELVGGFVELCGGKFIEATPDRPVYKKCTTCNKHYPTFDSRTGEH